MCPFLGAIQTKRIQDGEHAMSGNVRSVIKVKRINRNDNAVHQRFVHIFHIVSVLVNISVIVSTGSSTNEYSTVPQSRSVGSFSLMKRQGAQRNILLFLCQFFIKLSFGDPSKKNYELGFFSPKRK